MKSVLNILKLLRLVKFNMIKSKIIVVENYTSGRQLMYFEVDY